VVVVALALAFSPVSARAVDVVPASKAADYVGKDVTIEGRVVATHESPIAAVLAFAPNFAGFTATILAADRAKFPPDLDQLYRGRVVQLTGFVAAYRGKPEMTLREPTQVTLVVDATATGSPAPVQPPAPPLMVVAPSIEAALAAIDERLAALELRVGVIEQTLATQLEEARVNRSLRPTPVSRVRGLGLGISPTAVRGALGPPQEVRRAPDGSAVWSYGTGRSVTFNSDSRVVAWTGF
jgi:hypothetical protein